MVATGIVAVALTPLTLLALFAPVFPAPTRIEAVAIFTGLAGLLAAALAVINRARSNSAAAERVYVLACGVVVVVAMGFTLLVACGNVYFACGGRP